MLQPAVLYFFNHRFVHNRMNIHNLDHVDCHSYYESSPERLLRLNDEFLHHVTIIILPYSKCREQSASFYPPRLRVRIRYGLSRNFGVVMCAQAVEDDEVAFRRERL